MTTLRCLLCALVIGSATSLVACGDDGKPSSDAGKTAADSGTAGKDSAVADTGTPDKDASLSGKDSGGAATDAGDAAAADPNAQRFEVPSAGGVFKVTTKSGAMVKLDFPASAGGMAITATSVDPSKLAWGNDAFADAITDAIELSPDGTKFADPIKVTLPSKALLAFTFSTPGGVPNPLNLSADGKTLELFHFSTLGIVAPNQSCESQAGSPLGNGWSDSDDSQRCISFGAKTTYRSYGCKNYVFCYTIEAGCCVEPGASGGDCKVDDDNLTLAFHRANNGDQYPYCEGAGDTPYVQSIKPASLVGDGTAQEITLTGFGFEESGTVFVNTDMAVTTQWVSSTKAKATVPGTSLAAAGTLSNVGFVNEAPAGGFNWPYRSNMVSVPITAAPSTCPVPEVGASPIGICNINSASSCNCAEDYNSGGGYHTYQITCSASQCDCQRDSVSIGGGAATDACADKASVQALWTSLCAPLAGFCP